MNTPEMTKAPQTSLLQDLAALLRYWVHVAWTRIGGRRALILLAVAVVGAGLAFNWSWLAAIGVAPVLVALAPCAAMCALGLCMNKMMGSKSCSTNQGAGEGPDQIAGRRPEPPSTVPKTESDPT